MPPIDLLRRITQSGQYLHSDLELYVDSVRLCALLLRLMPSELAVELCKELELRHKSVAISLIDLT